MKKRIISLIVMIVFLLSIIALAETPKTNQEYKEDLIKSGEKAQQFAKIASNDFNFYILSRITKEDANYNDVEKIQQSISIYYKKIGELIQKSEETSYKDLETIQTNIEGAFVYSKEIIKAIENSPSQNSDLEIRLSRISTSLEKEETKFEQTKNAISINKNKLEEISQEKKGLWNQVVDLGKSAIEKVSLQKAEEEINNPITPLSQESSSKEKQKCSDDKTVLFKTNTKGETLIYICEDELECKENQKAVCKETSSETAECICQNNLIEKVKQTFQGETEETSKETDKPTQEQIKETYAPIAEIYGFQGVDSLEEEPTKCYYPHFGISVKGKECIEICSKKCIQINENIAISEEDIQVCDAKLNQEKINNELSIWWNNFYEQFFVGQSGIYAEVKNIKLSETSSKELVAIEMYLNLKNLERNKLKQINLQDILPNFNKKLSLSFIRKEQETRQIYFNKKNEEYGVLVNNYDYVGIYFEDKIKVPLAGGYVIFKEIKDEIYLDYISLKVPPKSEIIDCEKTCINWKNSIKNYENYINYQFQIKNSEDELIQVNTFLPHSKGLELSRENDITVTKDTIDEILIDLENDNQFTKIKPYYSFKIIKSEEDKIVPQIRTGKINIDDNIVNINKLNKDFFVIPYETHIEPENGILFDNSGTSAILYLEKTKEQITIEPKGTIGKFIINPNNHKLNLYIFEDFWKNDKLDPSKIQLYASGKGRTKPNEENKINIEYYDPYGKKHSLCFDETTGEGSECTLVRMRGITVEKPKPTIEDLAGLNELATTQFPEIEEGLQEDLEEIRASDDDYDKQNRGWETAVPEKEEREYPYCIGSWLMTKDLDKVRNCPYGCEGEDGKADCSNTPNIDLPLEEKEYPYCAESVEYLVILGKDEKGNEKVEVCQEPEICVGSPSYAECVNPGDPEEIEEDTTSEESTSQLIQIAEQFIVDTTKEPSKEGWICNGNYADLYNNNELIYSWPCEKCKKVNEEIECQEPTQQEVIEQAEEIPDPKPPKEIIKTDHSSLRKTNSFWEAILKIFTIKKEGTSGESSHPSPEEMGP